MSRPLAFAPFQNRSYRFQWPADLLTSCAFEMETLILGWYVLAETNSVVLLTVYGALLYVGTLIAPLLGVLSDRVGHRNVLTGMRAIYTAVAAAVMALAFARWLDPFLVCVMAGISGLVRPCDQSLRGAMIADTMPAAGLTAAMSFSRTTGDFARIAGALTGAGLFAAFGMGRSYVVVTACYLIGALLTFLAGAPARQLASVAPGASPWRDLRDGLVYVWNTPPLLATIWLACLFNFTTFPLAPGLFAYVARDIYGADQTGYGTLIATFSAGAVIGAFVMSRVGVGAHLARLMIVTAVLWHLLLLTFGWVHSMALGIAVLVVCGLMQSLTMICHSVLLLRAAGVRFRGRAIGVRMLAIYNLPMGLLIAGGLIGWIGFPVTVTLYAVIGIALTLVCAVHWRDFLWRGTMDGNAPVTHNRTMEMQGSP